MNIEMTASQAGDGDRGLVTRIMSRLTMAKVLKLMGHEIQNFIFYKDENNGYSYYPFEAVMSDIIEFLDTIDADYIWDEEEYTLTLNFDNKVTHLKTLADSITFGWDAAEYYDDDDLEGIVEYLEHGLRFKLEEYDGAPLMFFIKYYETLKENNLI